MITSSVNIKEASNVPAKTGRSKLWEKNDRTAATSREISPKEASFPHIYSFDETGEQDNN